MQKPRIRFGVIGLNHGHINSQTTLVLKAGGELAWVYAKEPDLLADFQKRFPQAQVARSAKEVLEDKSLNLIVTAAIMNERAPLAIEAMRHGKDVMSDKPGMTTLAQLAEVRRVQQQTHRIFSIMFGERFENAATTKAGELVKAGAIGKVVQTIGLGPHRTSLPTRPDWFFVKEKYGGILCDIAAHQYDQFLYFTGSTKAEVVASQVGNFHHPQHPGLEDFGDVILRGNGGLGYARIDWLTPDGLPTWGDTRLTVLGTEGYIEVRKNVDIAGRSGANHLFLVDQKGVQYVESKDTPLLYGEMLVNDIVNRTETVMPQAHCFLAMELALQAEAKATRVVLEK